MRQNKKTSNCVYVALHISEDVAASGEVARVLSAISEIFGDQAEKTHEISTLESREIIIQIKRPLLNTQPDEKEFFENLKRLFEDCAHLSPHFTQISSVQG